MEPTIRDNKVTGDIWRDSWGNLWYSESLISRVINLCERTKEACSDGYVRNLLADDILGILSRGEE